MAKQKTYLPIDLVLSVGNIVQAKNGFLVPLTAKLTRGGKPLSNTVVNFKQDNTILGNSKTDTHGEAHLHGLVPLLQQNSILEFRALYNNFSDTETVHVPKAITPPEPSNDPETIELMNIAFTNEGLVYVHLILKKEKGKAMKNTKVKLLFEDDEATEETDELGHLSFRMLRPIPPGEWKTVVVVVDGIATACKLTLYNPLPKLTLREILSRLVRRVGFYLLGVPAIFSFPMCVVTFLYIFMGRTATELAVDGAGNSGLWIVFFGFLAFIELILFIIYLLAFYFGIKYTEAKELLKDRVIYEKAAFAGDSRWEKLHRWIEEKKIFQKEETTTVKEPAKAPASTSPSGGKSDTWRIILLSVLSDLGWDVIGKVISKNLKK